MTDLFKIAAKEGYRYASVKGLLTTEDVMRLPLVSSNGPSLDNVALTVYKELEAARELSFVTVTAKEDTPTANKLEIIKIIIADRKRENAARIELKDKRIRKNKIAEALARLDDKDLDSASREDLQAEHDSL